MKIATLILVLALAGCSAESLPPKPRPSRSIQEQPEQNPSGLVTKMVPKEFAPGTYRVEVVPQPGFLESGYFEVCSDYMCVPGGSLLQSEYIPAGGNSVMIVPPNAVMVKLRGQHDCENCGRSTAWFNPGCKHCGFDFWTRRVGGGGYAEWRQGGATT